MSETTANDQTEELVDDDVVDDETQLKVDPEQEARRAYALAQVRQYPDTVLRMRAHEVEHFDEALETLAERMTTIMADSKGVGLAAPQVGVLQRLLVYQASPEAEPLALVNPVVAKRSDESDVGEEGCLSLGRATVTVDIERALSITVEAKSPTGEDVEIEASDFEARVIQHELDHLDGILIIDHAMPEQRREAMAKLRPQPGVTG